jgi:hypothetical protein
MVQKLNLFFYVYVGQSICGAKIPRFPYHVVLDSESEQPTDEDEESVHSIQGKETGLYIIFYFSN